MIMQSANVRVRLIPCWITFILEGWARIQVLRVIETFHLHDPIIIWECSIVFLAYLFRIANLKIIEAIHMSQLMVICSIICIILYRIR